MPAHKYDIILSARIELRGLYNADTAAQAIGLATRELTSQGELTDITVERQVLLDDDEAHAPEADTDYAARLLESDSSFE